MLSTEMYFTSDTHFGHKFMVERRGFADADAMDETLIRQWNAVIPENALVYHLGDVSFRNNGRTFEILSQLNGHKFLVKGNHDRLNSAAAGRFIWVKDYYECKTDDTDQRIVMCHYPMRTWNRAHYGAWNLHGHSHGNLAPTGGQLDVGVDTLAFRPYTYAEVAERMAGRPYVPVDHHASSGLP